MIKRLLKAGICIINNILFISACLCFAGILEARIVCVDTNTKALKSDGNCWQSPFRHLQDALDNAEIDDSIHEIWIARGIYRPTKTYAPKNEKNVPIIGGAFSLKQYNPGITFTQQLLNYQDNIPKYHRLLKTFALKDGVAIYGGFKGNEKSRKERTENILENRTILEGNMGEYAVWHVMTAGNDITRKGVKTTLDRLVIRNGNASAAPYYPRNFPLNAGEVPIYYHDDGGGLYVFIRSQINLNQVVFANNQAIAGGAIFVQDGSTLNINQCQFQDNKAEDGSAINIRHGGPSEYVNKANRQTTVIMNQCRFVRNVSPYNREVFTNDNQLAPHPPQLPR